MRRWLSVLAGVATLAITGMALAMAGAGPEVEEVEKGTNPETVVEARADSIPTDKVFSPEPITVDHIENPVKPVKDAAEKSDPQLPSDRTPPSLEILHPGSGQIFEQAEVVFEGTTEPGAAVSVGDQGVDVSDSGVWRIALILDPGENLVVFKAKDSAGNRTSASVVAILELPEEPEPQKPRVEEPKKEHPQEEPKKEKPKAEEPKKEERPKEEKPEDTETKWEFVAHQVYGECGETPPYDVFHGKAKPGSLVEVVSEYGSGAAEVGEHGEWEIKVIFETAPVGEVFAVKVKDQLGNHQVFEFVRTG